MRSGGKFTWIAVVLFGALAIGWILFRTWTTATGFPLLGVDAPVFLPQALSWADNRSLFNAVWEPAAKLDPVGGGRMIYHGFLFPIVLGSLLPGPKPEILSALLAGIQALAAILFILLLIRVAVRDGRRPDAVVWFWVIGFSVAAAHYSYGSPGRAEPMVAVLIYAALLGGGKLPLAWRIRCTGGLLGIVAALHPLAGGLAALIALACLAWVFPPSRALKSAVIVGGYAMLVFAVLITFIYPYSFDDWVFGTMRMGRVAMRPSGQVTQRLAYLWFNAHNWFLPAAVGLIATGGFVALRRHRPSSPWLFTAVIAAVVFGLYRFVFVQHWATYNLAPFLPLGFLGIFHLLTEPGRRFDWFNGLALLVLAGIWLAPAREFIQRASYVADGVSLRRAREIFHGFRERHPQASVTLDPFLFTLADPGDAVNFRSGGEFLIVPQAFRLKYSPPEIPDYTLVENHFQNSVPKLAGIGYAKDHRGCGFAIYAKKQAEKIVIPKP